MKIDQSVVDYFAERGFVRDQYGFRRNLGPFSGVYHTWQLVDDARGVWYAYTNLGAHAGYICRSTDLVTAYVYAETVQWTFTSGSSGIVNCPWVGEKLPD